MPLKFFWRCEGTTLDATHDFTAGDTTAALNSAAAINTDAAKIGTNGLDIPSSADSAQFAVSAADLIDMNEFAIGFWLRLVDFTDGANVVKIDNSASSNMHFRVNQTGADTATGRELDFRLRFTGGSNIGFATASADLQLNEWVFVVFRCDAALNDRRFEIYNNDLTLRTANDDLTTDWDVATGINQLKIGDIGGTTTDYHIDNFFIADAYDEPLQDNANITSFTEYGAGSGETGDVTGAAGFGASFSARVSARASMTAGIGAGSTMSARAAAHAAVVAGIGAASTYNGVLDDAIASVSAAVSADATAEALAHAVAAVVAGAAAGEVWAGHAQAVASLAAAGQFGAAFDAETQGLESGVVEAGTEMAAEFLAAAQAIAATVQGATLGDSIVGIAIAVAQLTAGVGLGAVFEIATNNEAFTESGLNLNHTIAAAAAAIGSVIAQVGLDAVLSAVAVTRAELTAGASFGAAFSAVGGIGEILPPAKETLRVIPRLRSARIVPRVRSTTIN